MVGHNAGVLGLVTAVIGAGFVLMGLNALVRSAPDHGAQRPPSPVTGSGFGSGRPSSGVRTGVAVAWMVLGVLFIVAAFTHLVP